MFLLQDQIITEILSFLIQCERVGQKIKTRIDPSEAFDSVNSVTYEARIFRALLIKMRN